MYHFYHDEKEALFSKYIETFEFLTINEFILFRDRKENCIYLRREWDPQLYRLRPFVIYDIENGYFVLESKKWKVYIELKLTDTSDLVVGRTILKMTDTSTLGVERIIRIYNNRTKRFYL